MMLCTIGSANEVFQWKRRDREGQVVKLRRDEVIARQHPEETSPFKCGVVGSTVHSRSSSHEVSCGLKGALILSNVWIAHSCCLNFQ